MVEEILEEAREKGWGIYQIPCPEMRFLGVGREPRTKTEYDTSEFRAICREIAKEVSQDLAEFLKAGCEIKGIVGVEGSPSCGVTLTHIREGERERIVKGEGILVEEMKKALVDRGVEVNYYGMKITEERRSQR